MKSFRTILIAVFAAWAGESRGATVTFTVNPGTGLTLIPVQVYGTNQFLINETPLYRQGGNRLTGYNWEQNASNAGNDFGPHNSDSFLISQMSPIPPQNMFQQPATVVMDFINDNKARNADSIVTLQMAGYVTADMNGLVLAGEVAPSSRWKSVVVNKGSAYTLDPDDNDANVYMDEFVNYLVTQQGYSSAGGVKYYSLDNEPALWRNTHARLHPVAVTYAEMRDRSIEMAGMVTNLDPGAQVLGPVSYGWAEFINLQSASDRSSYSSYNTANGLGFLNFFLDQMRIASNNSGRRLLHYLDVHWYPEAQGSNGVSMVRVINNDTSQGVQIARMQAPRSLWDPTYVESSWIPGTTGNQPITLIPRLQQAVNQYYPGTKLAITEYSYGAGNNISAGIATADALGIFGKYGVAACYWALNGGSNYVRAAYRLYLNYDGAGARFGNLSVTANTSSVTLSSVYASRNDADPTKVWVVALNKDYASTLDATTNLNLLGGEQISSMRVFRFDSASSTLLPVAAPSFTANSFTQTLPARSATIYEITLTLPFQTMTPTVTNTPFNTHTPTATRTPTPTETFTFTPTHTPTATATPTGTWYTATFTPTATSTLAPGTDPVLYPNPVKTGDSTLVQVVLGKPGDAKIQLYTVSCRKIADLVSPNLPTGTSNLVLKLRDYGGKPLSNGLYYAVVTLEGRRKILKLLVLR